MTDDTKANIASLEVKKEDDTAPISKAKNYLDRLHKKYEGGIIPNKDYTQFLRILDVESNAVRALQNIDEFLAQES